MPSKTLFKILSLFICFLLIFDQSGLAQTAAQLNIAGYLSGLNNAAIQNKFRPLHLRFLQYIAENNSFKLLIDKGSGSVIASEAEGRAKQSFKIASSPAAPRNDTELEAATKNLLNYFFIGLTLPNDSFWVNLRPDSPDNIIDDALAKTDVGKILLEADVQLKKDTAKFTSPDTPEGKVYWSKLYKKAGELFGSENITIPTLTRPWIVPGEIIIYESKGSAYVYKASLKVMLEEDYLRDASSSRRLNVDYSVDNFKDERLKQLNKYSTELIKESIIPKLTKEINTSKRYAALRQVYYSLILAQWFKTRFNVGAPLVGAINDRAGTRPAPTNMINLIDSKNLTNLTSKTAWSKDTYFQEYQKSFKDGEYNYQEPVYTMQGKNIRSYFSGGLTLGKAVAGAVSSDPAGLAGAGTARIEHSLKASPDTVANLAVTAELNPNNPSEVTRVTAGIPEEASLPEVPQAQGQSIGASSSNIDLDDSTSLTDLGQSTGKSGLIGKYEVIDGPVFNETLGILVVRLRDIETQKERTVNLKLAKRISLKDTKRKLQDNQILMNNKIAGKIVKWFLDIFHGDILAIEDNEYGIFGASGSTIIVTDKLSANPIVLFHEVGHSAIDSGAVSVDEIIDFLSPEAKSWFDAHISKGGRANLRVHYALRALQRDIFGEDDKELTEVIKHSLEGQASEHLTPRKSVVNIWQAIKGRTAILIGNDRQIRNYLALELEDFRQTFNPERLKRIIFQLIDARRLEYLDPLLSVLCSFKYMSYMDTLALQGESMVHAINRSIADIEHKLVQAGNWSFSEKMSRWGRDAIVKADYMRIDTDFKEQVFKTGKRVDTIEAVLAQIDAAKFGDAYVLERVLTYAEYLTLFKGKTYELGISIVEHEGKYYTVIIRGNKTSCYILDGLLGIHIHPGNGIYTVFASWGDIESLRASSSNDNYIYHEASKSLLKYSIMGNYKQDYILIKLDDGREYKFSIKHDDFKNVLIYGPMVGLGEKNAVVIDTACKKMLELLRQKANAFTVYYPIGVSINFDPTITMEGELQEVGSRISTFLQAVEAATAITSNEVIGESSKQAILTPIDELLARKNAEIIFSTPQSPEKRYHLKIQEDFMSPGLGEKKTESMFSVETVSQEGENGYPVAMLTGITMDNDGIVTFNWIITLDYQKVFKEIQGLRSACEPGDMTLIDTMALYFVIGSPEYAAQAKFLWKHLTSLQIKTDEDVTKFFQNAPKNLRGEGVGSACLEFLTSFMPIGSRIKSALANKESLDALDKGERPENTLIGKMFQRLGYEVNQKSDDGFSMFPGYILEKRRLPYFKIVWWNKDILGKHFLPSNSTPSAAAKASSAVVSNEQAGLYIEDQIRAIGMYADTLEGRQGKLKEMLAKGFAYIKDGIVFIRIQGLLNKGQFGHIGLGQTYGQSVVYIDQDYAENATIQGHELEEIRLWNQALDNELRGEVKSLGEVRAWMRENLQEAVDLTEKLHAQANQKFNVDVFAKSSGIITQRDGVEELRSGETPSVAAFPPLQQNEMSAIVGSSVKIADDRVLPGNKLTIDALQQMLDEIYPGEKKEETFWQYRGKNYLLLSTQHYVRVGSFVFLPYGIWRQEKEKLLPYRDFIIVSELRRGNEVGILNFPYGNQTRLSILMLQAYAILIKEQVILDVGSGSDAILSIVASRLGAKKIIGVELNRESVILSHVFLKING
ncbi:MAG: 50S ribosomal protein L11 methyltransferase, partial [Candidatus Omnitrophota bacterium]